MSGVDWVYMEHPDTGGTGRFPDEPGVVERQEAHGWVKADEPTPEPFVPTADGGQRLVETDWVDLVHPESGGTQRIPGNREALEGAFLAGWQYRKPDEPEPDPEPEADPKPKRKTKASADSDASKNAPEDPPA